MASKMQENLARIQANKPVAAQAVPATPAPVNPNPSGTPAPAIPEVQPSARVPETVPAATQEPVTTQNSDDEVNIIDPAKKIQLPTGERITLEEYNRRAMRHEQYVTKMAELDKEYKTKIADAEKITGDYKDAAYWRTLAANDPFASVYLQLRSQGKSEAEAFSAATIATGKSAPASQPSSVVGMNVGGITIPKPPNDDPDSPAYREWQETVYFPALAEQAADRKFSPRIKQLEDELIAVKSQATGITTDATARAARLAENNQTAFGIWEELKILTGIDVSKSPEEGGPTPEEFHELRGTVGQLFLDKGININDSSWMERNKIDSKDIEIIALRAKDAIIAAQSKKVQLQKPRATTNEPISGSPAAGTASNGKGGAIPSNRFGQTRMMANIDRVLKK